MPPPSPPLPFWMVTPEMLPAPPDLTWNTRSRPPPSMMVVVAPAPLMVRPPEALPPAMSRSPVAARSSLAPAIVRVYVPAGRVMVSASGLALAAMIASRSEQSALQAPSAVSAVFVTVKVAAAAGRRRKTKTTARAARKTSDVRAMARPDDDKAHLPRESDVYRQVYDVMARAVNAARAQQEPLPMSGRGSVWLTSS